MQPPPDAQQDSSTIGPPSNTKTNPGKTDKPLLIVALLVIMVAGLAYGVYQHGQVSRLNTKIAALESNQIPSKQFSNYNDCATNGGVNVNTLNGQFNACLEGGKQVILQYSSQNLPQITANQTTTTPNVVKSSPGDTSDLVNYLTYSYSGCNIGEPKGSSYTGYYKILKEMPSGWALLNSGCTNDTQSALNTTFIIAMKLSSGWVQLSPTNSFLSNGTPSCLLVDMYKIPESLTRQCFQNTGYNDGSLRKVTNP